MISRTCMPPTILLAILRQIVFFLAILARCVAGKHAFGGTFGCRFRRRVVFTLT